VKVNAHPFGVLSAIWAVTDELRFISTGVDGIIKIWRYSEYKITIERELIGHNDVVRDIAWKYYPETKEEIIISGGDVSYGLI
jgi:WD40 repeat protein